MALNLQGYVDLPANLGAGGFDHAAVHRASGRLYVAHTSNDALDVIDCKSSRYLHSIPRLAGVAGALVSEDRNLVFSSNRGEDTVSIFAAKDEHEIARVKVGVRPNGMAFDAGRGLLLAANVGNPEVAGSHTLSVVDVERAEMIHAIPVAGRTRWAVFDAGSACFYINIGDPSGIAVVRAADPTKVSRTIAIPAKGPHGLDLDPTTNRLFCACDDGRLFALDAASGRIVLEAKLSGTPDVIFFNPALEHLYVAIGDPGTIDVFETTAMTKLQSLGTEKGAHTIGFEPAENKVYAFLPGSQRASVYVDSA